jgi:hypothetical protein
MAASLARLLSILEAMAVRKRVGVKTLLVTCSWREGVQKEE